MLTAKETKGGDYKPIPEGVHRAVCVWLYDLGTHYNEKFKKSERKVLVGWELPDEIIDTEDGPRPLMISKRYTLSLHEKAALRHDLQAWRGRAFTKEELDGFDLHNILGKPCQIQVVHNTEGEKTYSNIAAIMALPKGTPPPPHTGALMSFDMDGSDALPEGTPKWVAEFISKSAEWSESNQATADTPGTPARAASCDEAPF